MGPLDLDKKFINRYLPGLLTPACSRTFLRWLLSLLIVTGDIGEENQTGDFTKLISEDHSISCCLTCAKQDAGFLTGPR